MTSDPTSADPGNCPTRVFVPHLDGLEPTAVLRRLRHRRRLVALMGAWHLGDALVGCDPVDELGSDPFGAELDISTGTAPTTAATGWIGAWRYDGTTLVGRYDLVLRRRAGRWWLEAEPAVSQDRIDALLADLTIESAPSQFSLTAFTVTPTPNGHQAAVGRVLDHLRAGDIFQANLCARLDAELTGDPLDVFCTGLEALRPAYAAYVASPDSHLVSFSPELFLRRIGHDVLTSPIKGTAPLSSDPAWLAASAKNRAENVMIVDLMRNDLGRVAAPGSVRVPTLTRVERHAVWHLVSDVVGHLEPDVTTGDLLRATFPPGSVTGAPKERAMQIIAELEPTPRHAYTGAIGHISPCGMELNVAIRTFEFGPDSEGAGLGATRPVWLGVGGGIVIDSDPADEFNECLVKAAPLIAAIGGTLPYPIIPPTHRDFGEPDPPVPEVCGADPSHGIFETVLVVDGQPVAIEDHVSRLDASLRSVWGTSLRGGLEDAARRRVAALTGRHRLRIVAVPSGSDTSVTMQTTPLETLPARPWSLEPRTIPGGWGAHKWVDRRGLDAAPGGAEPLILDTDGSVLETARASLFAVIDGALHTPALDGRLLPGTARERVIERAAAAGIVVHQHRLTIEDLARASEVFATNALRGVVAVAGVVGVTSFASPGPVTSLLAAEERPAVTTTPPIGDRPRVLFVDNHDSFVFNLVQYVRELGAQAEVVRNDEIRAVDVPADAFSHIVLSPGPGTPADAGICADLVRHLGPQVPILGVCLGHQVIGEVYGANVVRAREVVHGKASLVHHDGSGVLAGLPSPLEVGRYHSLVVEDLPESLIATAHTTDGVLMAMRHHQHPVEGVQFHPESILTSHGHDLLERFLRRRLSRSA